MQPNLAQVKVIITKCKVKKLLNKAEQSSTKKKKRPINDVITLTEKK